MTYTEKELNQFLHGISLSLLSKKSAQHWRYNEETAREIEWLEALERKVRADLADRKTENSSEKPDNCEDEPTWEQVKEYCNKRCLDIVDSALRSKWYKEEPHIVGKHADVVIIDDSQLTAKCLNCANGGSYKCSKCDGEMYFKDEPQTNKEIVLDPSFAELSDAQFVEAMKLIELQMERSSE